MKTRRAGRIALAALLVAGGVGAWVLLREQGRADEARDSLPLAEPTSPLRDDPPSPVVEKRESAATLAPPAPRPQPSQDGRRPVKVTGSVVFADGSPSADTAVTLTLRTEFGSEAPPDELSTDDAGHFTFERRIEREYVSLLVEVHRPGWLAPRRDFVLKQRRVELDAGVFRLDRGGLVTGQVAWAVPPTDRAYWYALVFPEHASSPGSPSAALPKCSIDAAGAFAVAPVPAGEVSVSLWHPLLGVVDEERGHVADGGVLHVTLESRHADPSTCLVLEVWTLAERGAPRVFLELADGTSVDPTRVQEMELSFDRDREQRQLLLFEGLTGSGLRAHVVFPSGEAVERDGFVPGTRGRIDLAPEIWRDILEEDWKGD